MACQNAVSVVCRCCDILEQDRRAIHEFLFDWKDTWITAFGPSVCPEKGASLQSHTGHKGASRRRSRSSKAACSRRSVQAAPQGQSALRPKLPPPPPPPTHPVPDRLKALVAQDRALQAAPAAQEQAPQAAGSTGSVGDAGDAGDAHGGDVGKAKGPQAAVELGRQCVDEGAKQFLRDVLAGKLGPERQANEELWEAWIKGGPKPDKPSALQQYYAHMRKQGKSCESPRPRSQARQCQSRRARSPAKRTRIARSQSRSMQGRSADTCRLPRGRSISPRSPAKRRRDRAADRSQSPSARSSSCSPSKGRQGPAADPCRRPLARLTARSAKRGQGRAGNSQLPDARSSSSSLSQPCTGAAAKPEEEDSSSSGSSSHHWRPSPPRRSSPEPHVPSGWCITCRRERSSCFQPGDWACDHCGSHNAAIHRECLNEKCKGRRMHQVDQVKADRCQDMAHGRARASASASQPCAGPGQDWAHWYGGRDAEGQPRIPSGWCPSCHVWRMSCWKALDWVCPHCGAHCYARKQAAHSLHTLSWHERDRDRFHQGL